MLVKELKEFIKDVPDEAVVDVEMFVDRELVGKRYHITRNIELSSGKYHDTEISYLAIVAYEGEENE